MHDVTTNQLLETAPEILADLPVAPANLRTYGAPKTGQVIDSSHAKTAKTAKAKRLTNG